MGLSWVELVIILAIVLLIFGGKRLASLGGDLGRAIKGFKQSMKEGDAEAKSESPPASGGSSDGRKLGSSERVVDAEVVDKKQTRA